MALAQFKEVSKIDSRIRKIHEELADLYERRNTLTKVGQAQLAVVSHRGARIAPIEKEYATLVNVWHRYGLKPPTLKYLKPSLVSAVGIRQDMIEAMPALKGQLSLVLVPPTKELHQALSVRVQTQRFVHAPDSVDHELSDTTVSLRWRLFVVYSAPEGLTGGSARQILADEHFMIGGHRANALGHQTYAALTMHLGAPLDQESWSMLLGDVDTDTELLPCATFENGRYRFDHDDLDNIFGDNRFRPAVEVQ